MKQRLMELYFTEGADLTDTEVLVGAARDCGMDADAVRQRLAGDEDVVRVSTEARTPRMPGSKACPASSSAECSRCRAHSLPSISPMPSHGRPPSDDKRAAAEVATA